MKSIFLTLVTATIVSLGISPHAIAGIIQGPFGSYGEGGSSNGQTLTFGSGGAVFEVDSFINISGFDLNGGLLGTSGQLSVDPLPGGLAFSFQPTLSGDMTDLTLAYQFTNNTAGTLSNVRFFAFVDAETDVPINDFFNEAGSVSGTVGSGAGDFDPDSWEIDEPGFVFGNIFDNLLLGMLDNTNNVPVSFPDDVSIALGFSLGPLNPLDVATVRIFLSDDGDRIGSLALRHFDTDLGSTDTLTMSGQASVSSVPEPSALALTGFLVLLVLTTRWGYQHPTFRRSEKLTSNMTSNASR